MEISEWLEEKKAFYQREIDTREERARRAATNDSSEEEYEDEKSRHLQTIR